MDSDVVSRSCFDSSMRKVCTYSIGDMPVARTNRRLNERSGRPLSRAVVVLRGPFLALRDHGVVDLATHQCRELQLADFVPMEQMQARHLHRLLHPEKARDEEQRHVVP